MQRTPRFDSNFWRFCGRAVLKSPFLLWDASKGWTTFGGIVAAYLSFDQKFASWGWSLLGGISPLWAVLPIGLLFLYGLMREHYEQVRESKQERKDLQTRLDDAEKRVASSGTQVFGDLHVHNYQSPPESVPTYSQADLQLEIKHLKWSPADEETDTGPNPNL